MKILDIALTNLGQYNEGILNFKWLSLPASEDEINETLKEIGIDGERYEEYFITDFESDFFSIGEYENLEHLNELAEQIDDLDDYQKEIVSALMDCYTNDIEEAISLVDDCYLYSDCNDFTDLAYQLVDEMGLLDGVPETLKNYFDYEAYGRDLSFENFYNTDFGILEVCR